jgi:hypothetical protein
MRSAKHRRGSGTSSIIDDGVISVDLNDFTQVPNSDLKSLQKSLSSDNTAVLYRFGQEIGTVPIRNSLPTTLPKMGNSANLEQLIAHGYNQDDENSYISQITNNLQQLKPASKTLKLVSGSQFRLQTKGVQPCQQCEIFEKMNKKNKETIRSLKLQLLRMEENFKDLKYTKVRDSAQSDTMKISLDTNSFVHSDDTELNQRCDALEDEVTKLKKVLQYERSIKDSMRNSLEETKRNSSAEIKRLSDEATLAINRSRNMEETITLLRSLQIEYEAKVNYYKDDLEKTEQQLQDALL